MRYFGYRSTAVPIWSSSEMVLDSTNRLYTLPLAAQVSRGLYHGERTLQQYYISSIGTLQCRISHFHKRPRFADITANVIPDFVGLSPCTCAYFVCCRLVDHSGRCPCHHSPPRFVGMDIEFLTLRETSSHGQFCRSWPRFLEPARAYMSSFWSLLSRSLFRTRGAHIDAR